MKELRSEGVVGARSAGVVGWRRWLPRSLGPLAREIYIYRERERERRDRDNRSQALGVSRASPCNRRRGEHAAAPGPCSQVITLLPKVGGCQEHLALAVLYVPYSALTVLYVPYSALTVLYVPYSALTVLYVPYSLDSRPGAYSSSSVLLSSLELSDTHGL